MTQTEKATERPWRIVCTHKETGKVATDIVGNDRKFVATLVPHKKEEVPNARLIVQAVNSFEEMREALKEAQSYILTRKGKEFNVNNSDYFHISVVMTNALNKIEE